jgi:hypothetical protein
VVLTLAAFWDGAMHQYASIEDADRALTHFGQAVSIDRVNDESGHRWLVTCETQRGETGAFRLHSIASACGVPVHVQ